MTVLLGLAWVGLLVLVLLLGYAWGQRDERESRFVKRK